MRRLGLLLLAAFLVPVLLVHAQEPRIRLLHGLAAVVVEVGVFADQSIPSLDSVALRTSLELRLRQSGLRVTTFSSSVPAHTLAALPLLTFKVTVLPDRSGYSATTQLEMREGVTARRNGALLAATNLERSFGAAASTVFS